VFMKELTIRELMALRLTFDEWSALMLMWEQSKRGKCPVGSYVVRDERDILILAGLIEVDLLHLVLHDNTCYNLTMLGLAAVKTINVIKDWKDFSYCEEKERNQWIKELNTSSSPWM
jgi:hypothetical protein